MLLGELFDKIVKNKTQIDILKDVVGDGAVCVDNELLLFYYNMVLEYETDKHTLYGLASNIKLSISSDNKEVTLLKIIILYESIELKIKLINEAIIKLKSPTAMVIKDLLSIRKDAISEYIYLSSIINKVMWGYELGNKSMA